VCNYDEGRDEPPHYIASTSVRTQQDDLSKYADVLAAASEVGINGLTDLHFRYGLTQANYGLAMVRAVEAVL
jgi:uncharacterized protein YggE